MLFGPSKLDPMKPTVPELLQGIRTAADEDIRGGLTGTLYFEKQHSYERANPGAIVPVVRFIFEVVGAAFTILEAKEKFDEHQKEWIENRPHREEAVNQIQNVRNEIDAWQKDE